MKQLNLYRLSADDLLILIYDVFLTIRVVPHKRTHDYSSAKLIHIIVENLWKKVTWVSIPLECWNNVSLCRTVLRPTQPAFISAGNNMTKTVSPLDDTVWAREGQKLVFLFLFPLYCWSHLSPQPYDIPIWNRFDASK